MNAIEKANKDYLAAKHRVEILEMMHTNMCHVDDAWDEADLNDDDKRLCKTLFRHGVWKELSDRIKIARDDASRLEKILTGMPGYYTEQPPVSKE